MSKKIAIGFDLGTTSVGWSIIEVKSKEISNENLEIIDMGVRLFDDPSSSDINVETRRIARGRRRRINRQKIRKHDLYVLLKKYNLVQNEEDFKNKITKSIYDSNEEKWLMPLDIKIKGLKEQLTNDEIVLMLHNYIKHRGTLNTIDSVDDEEEKDKQKLLEIYNSNLLPCENQYEWFKSSGKVLGNKENSIISNDDYKKEIRKILSNQKLISDKAFIDEFISIFERHRHYSEGPGSKKSPTPYGRWRYNENSKEIIKIGDNLWDALIGKCTWYRDEPRNFKKSPITEYFNLLNDFANIKIKTDSERYLTKEEKFKILETATYKKLTLDGFIKPINLKKDNIVGGLKKDSKDAFVIEKLETIKKIWKWLDENKIKTNIKLSNIEDVEFMHDIFSIGIKKQNTKERIEEFIKNKSIFKSNLVTDEMLENLSNEKIWSSGTSSLSIKAQLEFINFSLTSTESEGKNQMNYFQEKLDHQISGGEFAKYKYFPNNLFENEMMSATVKRSFNQAIKVLNGILQNKKYRDYEISHIFVELAREMNSKDEKDKIDRELKSNKKYLEELMTFHKVTEDELKRGENRLKFLLWCEQNKMDIYDGQPIDLRDMLNNPQKYHIDHVLPISVSLNDSMANKVVTKATNNELKGDLTPYQWLSKQGKYEEYKKRCENLVNEIPEKNKKLKPKLLNKIKNYLTYEKDLDNELQGFVSRQLNDSRYISTLFSNQLKKFFKESDYWKDKKIIIQPINGVLTTFARKNWFAEHEFENKLLIKNRDIYSHHAIDASIIAFLGLNSKIQSLLKYKNRSIKKEIVDEKVRYIDIETGKIVYEKSDLLKDQAKASNYFRDQMRNFIDKNNKQKFVRFSRMIENKTNLALSNETLYSLREYDGVKYKIVKINLLDKKPDDLLKYFEKKKEDVIMFTNDRNKFEMLSKIFYEFNKGTNENPFYNYLKSELITKILEEQKIDINKLDKIPLVSQNGKITSWIRNIRVKENEVKDINSKFILEKHNNKAFYDNLNPIGARIYKTKDGKYKVIFLNVLNVKWDNKNQLMVVDEEKIKKQLENMNINSSRYIELKKGKMFILNNELYYYSGGTGQLLEIKSSPYKNEIAYKYSNWTDAPQRNQWQISTSTVASKFKLCKVDELGNVYDIWTFDEYFENDMLKY